MAIPEYVQRMRKQIGNELLFLPSVSAVVVNAAGEVLLGRRADNGRWALVSGIMEPDEQPATAVVREVREETSLEVVPERLVSVVSHPYTYPNGDRCEYLNLGFRCRLVGGVAQVNDDESTAVEWFAADRLPLLDEHTRIVLAQGLSGSEAAWFAPVGAQIGDSLE